LETMENI